MNKFSRVAVVLCVMGAFLHNGLKKLGSFDTVSKQFQSEVPNVPAWVVSALLVVILAIEILAPIGVIVASVGSGSWTKSMNNTSLWFLIILSLIVSVALLPRAFKQNADNTTLFANTAIFGGVVLLLQK